MTTTEYAEALTWHPERPRFKVSRLLLSWVLTTIALWFAALILPGVSASRHAQGEAGPLPMTTDYAEALTWHPERPRFKLSRLLLSWLLTAAALWFAAPFSRASPSTPTEARSSWRWSLRP